ncbi:MAG: hypothetical protein ABSB35_19870 [Bryobacteraceae bacterium]|jgi:hypothetical protein
MEQAIAALVSNHRNLEETAKVAGISVATLKRWMRLPEFKAAYLQARREILFQANARVQINSGTAAAVLLKLMADPATPASVRARIALGLLELANQSLVSEDQEERIVALEQTMNQQKYLGRLSAARSI